MDSLKKAMPARVQITAILRKALFSGEYQSGDLLSLTEMAKQLGVSRTPVREAFQTLEAEGLIELQMNKSALVKPIGEKYITDHYEMRALLEAEAAGRAAVRGLPEAQALLKKLEDLLSRIDCISAEEYEELNLSVHTAIWAAADNERLYKFLSSLWNGPSVGFTVSKLPHYTQSTQEHIAVLNAILAKDEPAARQVMTKHINRSLDNILKNWGYQ